MNPLKERIRNVKDRYRFQRTLKRKEPYFGRYMSADQLQGGRKVVMQRLPEEKQQPFRLLEVGSWAGCSCVAWCETARDLNLPIIVYCVDPWEYY